MSLSASLVGLKGQRQSSWYRPMFKDAFRVAWNRKSLWFFGLFAALLSSGSEIWTMSEVFSRATRVGAASIEWRDLIDLGLQKWGELSAVPLSGFVSTPVVIVGSALVLIMSLLLAIAVVSQGSLFTVLYRPHQSIGIKAAWKAGARSFWKVAVVNVVARIATLFAFLVISLPLLSASRAASLTSVQLALGMLAFILFIPLMVMFSLATKFILVHAVNHTVPFHQSIGEAFGLLKRNWLVVLEFIVLIFLMNVAVVVGVRVVVAILMLPFLVGISLSYLFAVPVGVTVFYVGWIVTTLAFVLCSAAYVSTVEYAAWVLLYQHIAREHVPAKLVRVVNWMLGRASPSHV